MSTLPGAVAGATTDRTARRGRTGAPAANPVQASRIASLGLPALVPGLVVVGLCLVWAVHDGGTDHETWLWGALALIGLLLGCMVLLGSRLRPSRPSAIAIALFAAYVGWSFASIGWAEDRGAALLGSDMALMYLVVFALMSVLPFTERGALLALLAFTLGIGVIAIVLLVRLAIGRHAGGLFIDGRLAAPTGYFNATGALFSTEALLAIALASRRELPGPVRGLLLAFAAAGLDLAIVVQSRGWLFTLPFVLLAAILVCRDRLRVTAATVLPALAVLAGARRLVKVFANDPSTPLVHLGQVAARPALLLLFGVFVLGTVAAWFDRLRPVALRPIARRLIGTGLVIVALGGGLGVGLAVSHGHLGSFVARQWDGFSHEPTAAGGSSHFDEVGSGRYDIWRVALEAVRAHPIGGLGQGNFLDYYNLHRHTREETQATHSLEMRLLAHTGIVGFVLFAGCLIAAIAAAGRARRRGSPLARAVAGVAMLAFLVWLIHGSIDWFWEIPALSGPALGFLGVAGALGRPRPDGGAAVARTAGPDGRAAVARTARPDGGAGAVAAPARSRRRPAGLARPARLAVTALVGLAAVLVIALPYLSAREDSIASNLQDAHPAAALAALRRAGRLDPLDSAPQLEAGWDALALGRPALASASFHRGIVRDRDTWVGWLGAAVADSTRGDRPAARAEYARAHYLNGLDQAAEVGLQRVDTKRPLSYSQVINLLGSPD